MNTSKLLFRGFAPKFFLSALIALFAVVLMAGLALGQNITNTGTWTNTGTVTATNFTNSGASATFTNSGASSLLRIKNTLTTNASGANPENFDVTAGEVRYMGNGAQTINHLVKDNTYNNLSTTGAGASTKTLGGNITVAGTLTSDGSGVVVSIADKILTVTGAGNPIASAGGGTFTFSGGTVNYAGGAQNIYADTYGTLGITAAGNKTMVGNVTVNTNLSLSDGNLQIGSNTLTLASASITTGSGTLEGSSTSNMTFSGTGSTTLPAVTNGLGTLVVNRAGGTITLGGDLEVATALTLSDGTLHVGSTRTLTLNDAVTATSGTLTSAADGTVNYNKGSDGQSVLAANYGNLTFSNFNKTLPSGTVGIAGTFTPGTATGHTVTGNTISFNGAAQNIPSFNGATGYNNLTTAGGAVTKTVTGNLVVGGDFTNGVDVTTNVGTFTLSIAGARSQGNLAATMQFGGASNGLLFTTGTVEYNGANQNIAGDASDKYARLVLSGSGTKSVLAGSANTVHTQDDLTINSGVTLSVASGGFLNVDQNLTNNGTVSNAGTITVGN